MDGLACYDNKRLATFLANSKVLINLLPLTAQTENILNRRLFCQLPRGAYLMNLARRRHLVEQDLIPMFRQRAIIRCVIRRFSSRTVT
ncbi:MAG: hypothetical protein CR975_05430 [Gammaproteobacteria bacterium]|nr:MAG: hypothetical protein CR975_05430 [Gammaproteobacteria bacterium]